MQYEEQIYGFALGLLSAFVVAIYNTQANKKRYFDQQWWDRKAIKYEEVIETLGKLEIEYSKIHRSNEGMHPQYIERIDYPKKMNALWKKIDLFEVTSLYYLDPHTYRLLRDYNVRLYDEFMHGSGFQYDEFKATYEELKRVKSGIIENAKTELPKITVLKSRLRPFIWLQNIMNKISGFFSNK